jgi:hypothetical protein
MRPAAVFSCADLDTLAGTVAQAWRSGSDRDWSVPAGSLDWSCTATADHAIDTVLAPAFFLASRKQDDYPAGGPFTMGPDARPDTLIEGIETASRVLIAVVTVADPDVRAVIWRSPRIETRGPADFVPRGALELLVHGHDVCTGLDVAFDPPTELCERLRAHTQLWPHWGSPGWTQLSMTGNPFVDLLRSSGREPRH